MVGGSQNRKLSIPVHAGTGSKVRKLKVGQGYELIKISPSDVLPPGRPYLLKVL